jgi:REP element-mobilizing transposase RayT
MANTYTQLYIHLIFAVSGRTNSIKSEYKIEIEKYISGFLKNKKHKLLAINCMPDHSHIFIGLNPEHSVSNLVREMKISSANFINEKKLTLGKFSWQEGYGAFSYSKSSIDNVIKYINNQQEHHRKKSFQEEYINFLNKYNISFDERYIFKSD